MTREQRLEELAKLVGAWRSARCTWPLPEADDARVYGRKDGTVYKADCDAPEYCVGDNHLAECPVEIARQDVIAAHNALGAPGMP